MISPVSFYGINTSNAKQSQRKINSVNDSVTLNTRYVNADTELLAQHDKRPLKSISGIKPENLALVHMTNYFPEGGQITSVKNATQDENNVSQYRSTVHFALNHVVYEHKAGNGWHNMNYGLILPFDKTMENLRFVMDNVNEVHEHELPDGTVIVKHNPDIPKGKLKITNLSETKEDFRGTKNILLVETSDSMQNAVSDMIEKAGYSRIDKISNKAMGISDEYAQYISNPQKLQQLYEDDPDKYIELTSELDYDKYTDFQEKSLKSWIGFCKKYNLTPCQHTYSPWGRSEHLIECIKLAGLNNNSWHINLNSNANPLNLFGDYDEEETNESIDYQKEFIKVIDEIKAQMPEGKSFSYDIDKLRQIIISSKTPSEALERIQNELHLTYMAAISEDAEIPNDSEIFMTIDTLLGISEPQKEMIENLYQLYK